MIKTIYIDEYNIIHFSQTGNLKELSINFPDVILHPLYDPEYIYKNTFIEVKETFNSNKAQTRRFELQELMQVERNKLIDCLEFVLVKVNPPYNPLSIHTQMEKYRSEIKHIDDIEESQPIVIRTYEIRD